MSYPYTGLLELSFDNDTYTVNEKDGGVSVCVTLNRDFRAWCDGRYAYFGLLIRLLITVDMESSGGMMHMHKASILSQRTGGYEL